MTVVKIQQKKIEECILAKSSMRGNYKRTNSEDSNDASSNKSGERSLNSYYSERWNKLG